MGGRRRLVGEYILSVALLDKACRGVSSAQQARREKKLGRVYGASKKGVTCRTQSSDDVKIHKCVVRCVLSCPVDVLLRQRLRGDDCKMGVGITPCQLESRQVSGHVNVKLMIPTVHVYSSVNCCASRNSATLARTRSTPPGRPRHIAREP